MSMLPGHPPANIPSAAVAASNGGAILTVRVTPRARTTSITEITPDAVRIRIQSPPVDGKANKVLLKSLATWLGLPASHLTLMAGGKGRTKRIHVRDLPPDKVLERLRPEP